MEWVEYVRIKIEDIPQEFIEEYNLIPIVHNVWVYFDIVKGCYGWPQSGMLANKLLHTLLNKEVYFEATTTCGLWKHKWQPIQFCLLVNYFCIEYVGESHIHHLRYVLKQHYKITED